MATEAKKAPRTNVDFIFSMRNNLLYEKKKLIGIEYAGFDVFLLERGRLEDRLAMGMSLAFVAR